MKQRRRKRLTADEYAQGILAGDRIILSRAITLIESALPEDNELAETVLEKVLPQTGNSLRIGITGVPGVGKSTFIESFGKQLTSIGKKVAVLTVDPSSQLSKGSILGDKTRMEELAHDPLAYIRPSASGSALGGVNAKTRESMLLCEAAGFEAIIIETVGVGQSETTVHGLVDFFLLLMLAGAGDELQGIKRGIMEMADTIAITKADGDNLKQSKMAQREYKNALHLFPPSETEWYPKVLTCSSLEKTGLDKIWETIVEYESHMKTKGFFNRKRQKQNLNWMHETIHQQLEQRFYHHPAVNKQMSTMEQDVMNGEQVAIKAAKQLLELYFKS
ncbi:methylmalonyl Co-A mutase-associated GTPase MeaB [Limibacter armeniacum]|uniref:methylmalonyl Co-A mutase-associated GTPase MeaB n=1 Tax=Limibacter armeniacum TaxID=466084 RepID=UPI002FE56C60